jgi:hypothetical protein
MMSNQAVFVADEGEFTTGGGGEGDDIVITRKNLEIEVDRLDGETMLYV